MFTWIPRGHALPPEVWAARHRALLLLLVAHLVVLPAFAVTQGWSMPAAWAFDIAPALLGAAACVQHLNPKVRSSLCATALLTCSAVLVVAWHGTTEAHFHYFVMVGALALYQQWWTFLLAIGFVVVQHGLFGAVHAGSVFQHSHHPLKWAAIHGAFVAALAVTNLVSWRESERGREATDASEERFKRAFDDAPVAIALVSPRGQVLQANRDLRERTGHEHPEGLLLWDFLPEHDRVALAESWPPAPGAPEVERPYVRADGSIGWFLWRHSLIRDTAGQPDHWVFQGVDITARRQDAERLDHQAHHDALTALPNRARFDAVLEHALAGGRDVAVIFADLDDFKIVNDSLGHGSGDQLLVQVAERLTAQLRPDDVLARFGGDEFVILLEDFDDLDGARRAANRLAAALEAPFELRGHERFLTASFGLAIGRGGAEALLRDADAAMYHAKAQGKARLEVFDESLRTRALERLMVEARLREAIAGEQFELYYQPQNRLADGTLYGMEAVLRWEHPEAGVIAPETFAPIAEETGLSVPIGEWVIHTACRQAAAWRADGHPKLVMAVNLSAKQLANPSLERIVADALRDHGLPPDALCLEITETAITDATQAVLQRLKGGGVRLAIDDFGVGPSSLAKLQSLLPVNALKIHKSFVDGIPARGHDRAIIAAILSLAGKLGAVAIAQGVEDAAQAEALSAMGCPVAQGSEPLPAHRCLSQSVTLSAASPALSPALRTPTPASSKIVRNLSA